METGYIYIIRNKKNDKVYIGQTTLTPEKRFLMHTKNSTLRQKSNIELYKAISSIGKDNFYVETLESNVPLNELDDREMYYIEKFDSCGNGYNSTMGGKGGFSFSKTEQKEVLEYAKQGLTSIEIADIYGVNKATVLRFLHKSGFRYYGADVEKIKEMVCLGKTNKDIAKEIGIDKVSVSRILHRNGIRKHKIPVACRKDFDYESLKTDYENQIPIDDICEKYDISRTTFYRIRKNMNFEKREKIR